MDHDSIFDWFTKCITDLEPETQKLFFNQKLLKLPASSFSTTSFDCLKAYFLSINVFDQRLKKGHNPPIVVERIELVGMACFWDILTDTPKEDIADLSIDTVLNMSYLHVTPRLKKDPTALHNKFIQNCYSRLEEVCRDREAFQEGCELETACGASPAAADRQLSPSTFIPTDVTNATRTLTAISVSKVLTLPVPTKGHFFKII